uniref:Uncharacterized protein n=1 Tax=Anguilla anguilla TaxID=7936 RepID=A0A0E9TW42_ANGAN
MSSNINVYSRLYLKRIEEDDWKSCELRRSQESCHLTCSWWIPDVNLLQCTDK